MRLNRFLIATALGAMVAAPVASGATIPVTTTADVVQNGDGLCSLREAFFAARADAQTPASLGCVAGTPGEDVIQLQAAEYRLAAGGAREDGNESGDLDTGPSSVVRIAGAGMNATVIGGAGDRVFDVFAGATLSLNDLTVRDGSAPEGQSGGAVRSRGTFTALRVAFVNNAAGAGHTPDDASDTSFGGGGGGAIISEGQLQIAASLFSGNRAGDGSSARTFVSPGGGSSGFASRPGGDGGSILVSGGSATITSSTFTGGRAGDGPQSLSERPGGWGGDGGAVAVTGGSASIENATFQGNRAGNSGAPRTYMDESAVPGGGGAVAVTSAPGEPVTGTATVTFSTFSGNTVGVGSEGDTGSGASVQGAAVSSSILADTGGACASLSVGRNVVLPGDTSCPGGIAGDPRLGPLAANGGPVPTMAPGAGSPAIDAIVGVPCPAADARGLARPQFAGCDAGAVEVQPGAPGAPGGPGGPGGGAAVTRTLTGVSLTKAAFRTYGRKKSTTVRFTLGEASPVVLSVRRAAPGRKASGGRCVAPTRRLAGARRCVRQITLPGRVRKAGAVGANSLLFTGRLRGRALPPGRYTLVLTLPAAGGSPPVAVTRVFRILP